MCDFIFIGLHRDALPAAREALPKPLDIYPSTNNSLLALLPPAYQGFWLVQGQCSCGLWPPSAGGVGPEHFRGRKWSKTKVERAVADLRNAAMSRTLGAGASLLVSWLELVPKRTRLPLYAHVAGYDGDQNLQRFTPQLHRASTEHLRAELSTGELNEIQPPVA